MLTPHSGTIIDDPEAECEGPMRIVIRSVNYKLTWLPRGWWWQWWTPNWHKGRGPYISIGLWFFAFYRGY